MVTNRNTRRLRRRAISLIASGTDSLEDVVGSMVGGEVWSSKVASDGCVTSCVWQEPTLAPTLYGEGSSLKFSTNAAVDAPLAPERADWGSNYCGVRNLNRRHGAHGCPHPDTGAKCCDVHSAVTRPQRLRKQPAPTDVPPPRFQA